jgi:hypothetical protein
MALMALYEKVRETPDQVEYRFGYPDLARRLLINKRDRTCQATGGLDDPTAQTLAGEILYQERTAGVWPGRGMVAA